MIRAGLICNPSAGGGRAAAVARSAEECLRQHDMTVTVHETRGPGEAQDITRELSPQLDTVVAVGGDGTVNEVVNGLAGQGVPLGIIPAGTVNVLALELGIPFDVHKACALIAAGRTATLDLGTADGRRFALMLGAGLDALTIRNLDPRTKRRFRELGFITTGVKSYLHEPRPEFEVEVDGRTYRGTYAVVGNCRYYGGRFGVTSRADPTDGVFDVLVYQGQGLAQDLLFWVGVPLEWHVHHPGATYLRGRNVKLRPLGGDDTVWFQTDGELAGTLPVSAAVEQRALQVFAAREHSKKEKGAI